MRYGNISSPDVIDTTCDLVKDLYIDDYTKLLLHCDTNNDSAKNHSVTANNISFSTTCKFGGWSAIFNGSSSYFSIADSNDWYFGNADFTIDFWVRFNSVATEMTILSQFVDISNMWQVRFHSSGLLIFEMDEGGVQKAYFRDSSFSPSVGVWYHIAIVKYNGNGLIFVDGVSQDVSLYYIAPGAMPNFAAPVEIGRLNYGAPEYFNGLLDEVRISKGVARWTSNFTPPTQSYDCPLDTYTRLLIHGGGPNNGATFYDNSTTARTVTTAGAGTIYDASQYKLRVSSIYFNGSTSYLTCANSADWNFGSGDFTVDCWIRTTGNGEQGIWMNATGTDGQNMVTCRLLQGTARPKVDFTIYVSNVNLFQITTSEIIYVDTWHHVAVVKSGSDYRIYVDGVSSANGTYGTAYPTFSGLFVISGIYNGAATPIQLFSGWMDEFRVTKYQARWTSTFTPPSAPYDSPLTQYVIDGLDGDTDKEYRIIAHRVVGGTDSNIIVRPNNDTGSNYGLQRITGIDTAAAAANGAPNTAIVLDYYNTSIGDISFIDGILYSKTGKVRTFLNRMTGGIVGTTVNRIVRMGQVWNNTVDNIATLSFSADQPNGVAVGSRIILLKKRQLTTGMKTGTITPVGSVYGHWQKIYDNTLTVARTDLMLTSQIDSYTKLLLHCDGADTVTAFYDFSNSAHVITANGNAQVDTTQSKFGGASALFDGTGDYLSAPDSDDWYFGTGDFTIDLWVRFSSVAADQMFYTQFADSDNWFQMKWATTNVVNFTHKSSTAFVFSYTFPFTPSTGTWYHIALVHSGGTNWYGFVNGVSQTLTTVLDGHTVNNIGAGIRLGMDGSDVEGLTGWLDEVRISKGIARWTANFTPPTQAYNELDGDRDVMYRVIVRHIGTATAGSSFFRMRPNGDAGTNYGYQRLTGASTTADAFREGGAPSGLTGVSLSGISASTAYQTLSEVLFYVKSGYVRTLMNSRNDNINGTTVDSVSIWGWSWSNTTDKITALILAGGKADALGIGTHVELWRLNL